MFKPSTLTLLPQSPQALKLRVVSFSFLVILSLLSFGHANAAKLKFLAPEPLNTLIETHMHIEVEDADATDPTVRQTLFLQASEEINELLATEGYFSSKLSWQKELTLMVEPGPRTQIQAITIRIDGPVSDEQKKAFQESWLLQKGAPFTNDTWNIAKQELLRDVSETEFPEARIVHSKATIDKPSQQASLEIHIDLGARHVYGEVIFEGLERYESTLIQTYTGMITKGEPYRRADLLRLQTRLQSTPYFSAVAVRRQSGEVTENGDTQLNIVVTVVESAQHRLSFGIGASSNNGGRAQVSYMYPDLFGYAWDFLAGFKYEQNKQQLFSDIFFPRKSADSQNSIGAVFEQEEVNNLALRNQTFRAAHSVTATRSERRYSSTLERSTEESVGPNDPTEPSQKVALVNGVSQSWRMVDNLTLPKFGFNLFGEVMLSSDALISDTTFAFVNIRAQHFHSFGDFTFVTRAELGANFADDVTLVPERYLFRTGGSNSIRGFDYLSIGIDDGEIVRGANRLFVASTEMNYWFNDTWAGAIFLDAGNAKNDMEVLNTDYYGYGLGVRYATLAGPLAIDIAHGNQDDEIRLHFNVTIPF